MPPIVSFRSTFAFLALLSSIARTSSAWAADSEVAELKKVLAIQTASLEKLKPGPWQTVTLPSGWTSIPGNEPVQCRRHSDWIEFKGAALHPKIIGWPVPQTHVPILPPVCRPQSTRFTEMPCHGAEGNSVALVCNNDFYADGRVLIHTTLEVTQQRFEGFRIWGGSN